MNAMPTAAAAGKIDVGDLRVQPAGIRRDANRLRDLGRSARSTKANPLAALSR